MVHPATTIETTQNPKSTPLDDEAATLIIIANAEENTTKAHSQPSEGAPSQELSSLKLTLFPLLSVLIGQVHFFDGVPCHICGGPGRWARRESLLPFSARIVWVSLYFNELRASQHAS